MLICCGMGVARSACAFHCTEATTSAARSSIAFDIVELKDATVAMKTMIAHSCAVGSGNSLLV